MFGIWQYKGSWLQWLQDIKLEMRCTRGVGCNGCYLLINSRLVAVDARVAR